MKTPLLYGTLIAIIGALLTFGLFFAGYHDTPEKMKSVGWLPGVVGFVATIVGYILALRERRAEYPADKEWGYGSAFGTAFMTGLVSTVIGAVLSYVYLAIVNPHFAEVTYQAQVAAMEAKGIPSAQIEQAEPMMRKFINPTVMVVMQLVLGTILSAVIALIVAIFFRNREQPLAAVEATPPAL